MAAKKYYNAEECNLAKSVTLFDYLNRSSPADIKRIHGDEYTLETDPYLHFHENNPLWISYDAGKSGGATALKYLMTYRDMSYPEAVGTILETMQISMPDTAPTPVPVPVNRTKEAASKAKEFVLPPKAENYRRVFAYLSKRRCIDSEIIEEMMKSGRLYEEADKHNCVFVGLDFEGSPVYGMRRGTSEERFVGDVKNSSKAYAFSLYLGTSEKLIVCESPIDVLSIASLIRMRGQDHRCFSYTSLSGIYTPSRENYGKLPVTLDTILEHYKDIKSIILCFDGDKQGKETSDYIAGVLTEKNYDVSSVGLHSDMDINDVLCINHQIYSIL